MTNFADFSDDDPIPHTLATHTLAFLVRGLCTDLKHIIAYFFTGNVTSFQLMPLFWLTMAFLEASLNLHVCAAEQCCFPQPKVFQLHSKLTKEVNSDVVYKRVNIFAPTRFMFFFADSLHLIKTAGNCLYSSGFGSHSCLMRNDGQYMVLQYIAGLFYSNQEFALYTLSKLTLEHIVLTFYRKMKVNLAVQVLSKSASLAVQKSGKQDVTGTAEFLEMTVH